MGAHALFAAAQKPESQKPLIQRDFAVLKDRADCDRKGLNALFAFVNAGTGGLSCQPDDPRSVAIAAMRANRAVRPMQGF